VRNKTRCLRLIALLLLGLAAFAEQPEFRQTQYVVGIRRKGPSWTANFNSPEAKRLLEGHVAVIKKMTASGKLLGAGAFTDPNELRGLMIFRDCTVDQAREMAYEDPVVKSGQISIEFHVWTVPFGLRADK
jgi:uncharacterized protein YciI